MFTRLPLPMLVAVLCLALGVATAEAGSASFHKTGKSGQVYTWSAGHC